MDEDRGYLYDLLVEAGASEFVAETVEFLLEKPLRILLILVVSAVVIRWSSHAIRRSVRALHRRTPLGVESIRAEARADTLGDAAAGTVRFVGWAIAFLMVLDEVGIDLAPLLAGAGIAGIAIGFGAQSLVRDVLSGLFILAEDRYGVGDVVDVGTCIGTVEDVNLRVTRLRSVDGTVWFVNNGEITSVGNSSMEWSRVLLDVTVAFDNDPDRVRELIVEEAAAVCESEPWKSVVVEGPELWGAEAMGPTGITMRLVVKTLPKEQYALGRELRGRISARLRAEGVRGPGQSVLIATAEQPGG